MKTKTVAFSENELDQIVSIVEAKIEQTQTRLEELKATLDKLKKSEAEALKTKKKVETPLSEEMEKYFKPIDNQPEKEEQETLQPEEEVEENAEKSETTESSEDEETETPIEEKASKEPDKEEEEEEFTIPEIDLSRFDWPTFVTTTLKNQDQPLTNSQLVDFAIAGYGLSYIEPPKVSSCIVPVLNQLVKIGKLKKKRIKGVPVFFYGYKEWFKGDELKAEYLKKAKNNKPPKSRKKAKK